jgi:hypothetical protein
LETVQVWRGRIRQRLEDVPNGALRQVEEVANLEQIEVDTPRRVPEDRASDCEALVEQEETGDYRRDLVDFRAWSIRAVASIYWSLKDTLEKSEHSPPELQFIVPVFRNTTKNLSSCIRGILENPDDPVVPDSLLMAELGHMDFNHRGQIVRLDFQHIGGDNLMTGQIFHQLQQFCLRLEEGEAIEGCEYLRTAVANIELWVAEILQQDESTPFYESSCRKEWTRVAGRGLLLPLEVNDQPSRLLSRQGNQSCFFSTVGDVLKSFGYTADSYLEQTRKELARVDFPIDRAKDYERYREEVRAPGKVRLGLLVYSGLPEYVALAVFRFSQKDGTVSLTVFTCGHPLYVVCAYIEEHHIMSARVSEEVMRWDRLLPYFQEWIPRISVIHTRKITPLTALPEPSRAWLHQLEEFGNQDDLQLELGGRDNGCSQLEASEEGATADVNRSEPVLTDEPEPLNHLDDEHEQPPRSVMAAKGTSDSNFEAQPTSPTESEWTGDGSWVVASVQADTNVELSPHVNDQMLSDTSDSNLETQPASSTGSELTGTDSCGITSVQVVEPTKDWFWMCRVCCFPCLNPDAAERAYTCSVCLAQGLQWVHSRGLPLNCPNHVVIDDTLYRRLHSNKFYKASRKRLAPHLQLLRQVEEEFLTPPGILVLPAGNATLNGGSKRSGAN